MSKQIRFSVLKLNEKGEDEQVLADIKGEFAVSAIGISSTKNSSTFRSGVTGTASVADMIAAIRAAADAVLDASAKVYDDNYPEEPENKEKRLQEVKDAMLEAVRNSRCGSRTKE